MKVIRTIRLFFQAHYCPMEEIISMSSDNEHEYASWAVSYAQGAKNVPTFPMHPNE